MSQKEREQIVEQGLAAIRELMQWWAYLSTYREAVAALLSHPGSSQPGTVANIKSVAKAIAEEPRPGRQTGGEDGDR